MAMTNLEALRAQCKLICNTCYVDSDVLQLALHNAGIDTESRPTWGAWIETLAVTIQR